MEQEIFNENTNDERRKKLIVKRNTIQLFIELPEDLINEIEINECNSVTTTNEN